MSLSALKITLARTFGNSTGYLVRLIAWAGQPGSARVALAVILLIAALFRFSGLDWDEGRHLHPDERFLTSVTYDLKWPEKSDDYFNPDTSTLSPYSLPNMGLYVYGTLPVYLVKWVAIALDRDDYDQIVYIGRAFAGLFDILSIGFLFLIGRRLYGQRVALLGAVLITLAVLNIQLAHFYTVDPFANLFVVMTMYFVLRASQSGHWYDYALTGLAFGMGMASKISVLTLALPILLGVGIDFYRRINGGQEDVRRTLEHTLVRMLTVFFLAALTFRVLQPMAFQGPEFWNWSLNPRWLRDIDEQQKMTTGEADFPPIVQWANRTAIIFPLQNIVLWGLGLPLGLAAWAGWALAAYELLRRRMIIHLLPVAYVGATFAYHGIQFVKFMRYFLPIYPFLALLAAYLLAWVWRRAQHSSAQQNPSQSLLARSKAWLQSPGAATILGVIVVGGTLLYALGFASIYARPHPRVEASRWIYTYLTPGSGLANEHWDDALPIGGLDGKASFGDGAMFRYIEIPNYEDDNPDKLNRVIESLSDADYLILSSNRLYDSIPRMPMRYPMTTRYYQLLFAGQLGYTRIAEFTSYPQILGIKLPDQSAEESFSVYDHPRVQIFKKNPDFDPEIIRQRLADGIDFGAVVRLAPRESGLAPRGLMLSPTDLSIYDRVARTTTTFDPLSLANQYPVLVWFLALQICGLLVLPLAFLAFGNLADRGYSLARPLGLLLIGWAIWMAASLRVLPFTWWSIGLVALLVAAVSGIIMRARYSEMIAYFRANRRMLLIQEGLFWGFFLLALLIRWRNPDLWHPGLGGEKPMDMAYLNAVTHSPYFPPYDPWFAGGYINYYYFGFVLTGTLIHMTGVIPTTAYNLAVPTFFAMTAMGGFTVAYNLVEGRRVPARPGVGRLATALLGPQGALLVGILGALFVAVIGNLGELQLLWKGVQDLSNLKDAGKLPFVLPFAKALDGLMQIVFNDRGLNFRTEWWYWNATRVIPAGEGEAGPINEFPFFTFLYADLHAHMMALPYTLLALGLSIGLIRERAGTPAELATGWRRFPGNPGEILTLGFLALTIGALWPLNTWDFPTYAIIAAAALACREYARRGCIDLEGVWAVAWRWGLIIGLGRLLFLPFHQNYASAYFGAEWWKGSRTPFDAYLVMHGFFLFILGSYMVIELLYGRGHNALVRVVSLTLRRWRNRKRVSRLFTRMARPKPVYILGVSLGYAAIGTISAIFLLNQVYGLILAFLLLATLLLFSTRPEPYRQLTLCLIGLGLILTFAVEFIVLKGDISRMNTVFKFYLQVWVLWAIASAYALPMLAARLRPRPIPLATPLAEEQSDPWLPATPPPLPWSIRLPRFWWQGFSLLLCASLLYPILATRARISDRFEQSRQSTLDGTAYMNTAIYRDNDQDIELQWDKQAITWLRANVNGLPTIVEANTPLYRWGSRISIYTGLPGIIGWDWHQKQQRSIMPGQIIERRIEDVHTIYRSSNPDEIQTLLKRYDVRYIYVGALERAYYAGDGIDKFERLKGVLWDVVYQNEQVRIYQVR